MKIIQKVLVCVLALILCGCTITTSAEIAQAEPQKIISDSAIIPEGTTELLGTPTNTIISGTVYNIVNANSGKYLNVHYGYDSNGTNVYQWTADGSDEQQFKVVYDSATASYKIYAMCSSNGTNRVLDIERNGAAVAAGQNVEIWTPVDPTAQNWTITNMGNNYFKISPKANTSLALTAYGTSNGTSGGRTSTSAGNVFLSTYDTYITQLWTFEEVTAAPPATPTGRLESVTAASIKGYAWRSDIPNTPISVKIYIENSEGEDVPGSPFTVAANLYRSDLTGYGNKYHGFQLNFNWNTVPYDTYTVTAYAINATGGTVQLTASPKTYTVQNTLGYLGYAVYRDLGFWADLCAAVAFWSPNDWHAGLLDEEYICYTDSNGNIVYPDCVIHMPGWLDEDIDWIKWADFLGGETYRGTYMPKDPLTHNDRLLIAALATELTTKDIQYVAGQQMNYYVRDGMTKIEPSDIAVIRCDGLVEYCYEYYGYRVFGSDASWDISKPGNMSHHSAGNIMPQDQAQLYLEQVLNQNVEPE